MKKESGLSRKISDMAYCNKELNRTMVEIRKSWNYIYKILNRQGCGKKKKD